VNEPRQIIAREEGPPPTAKPPQRAVAAGWVALGSATLVAGVTILFLFDPSESALYPPCPFRACTGLYCPGCGTTRALYALLHGNFGEAFGLNPLMVLLLPLLGCYLICYTISGARGRPLPVHLLSPSWGWLAFGTILAYWMLRNVPLYPFSLLAP
jgi:hypothetical protein